MTDDVVISGAGALTAFGLGVGPQLTALLEQAPAGGSLAELDLVPLVPDRRMLKAIARRDGIGLAALADALRHARYEKGRFPPERVGLYVGAPPTSAVDGTPHDDAVRAARAADGGLDMVAFGRASQDAKPAALLLGLPNNVLCYGSIMMDARGPNSNYTAGPTGGHLAVLNAARRLSRGQLDLAAAGGYGATATEVERAVAAALGFVGPPGPASPELAEGAAFLVMERRESAEQRGARPLARYVAGAAACPGRRAGGGAAGAVRAVVERALGEGAVEPRDVAVILVAAPDAALSPLQSGLASAFGRTPLPAVGRLWRLGQLVEASGLLELALASRLAAAEWPEDSRVGGGPRGGGAHVLTVVAAPSGACTCIAVAREPG